MEDEKEYREEGEEEAEEGGSGQKKETNGEKVKAVMERQERGR